ncbi:MAG TPA: M23 family metallopeptidase [Desulfobacteraceae bacterium]|nr:M23 family metallopeptidase [Desulfobacteraceae bacterium]
MASENKLRSNRPPGKASRIGRKLLFFVILLAVGAAAIAGLVLFEREKPTVTVQDGLEYLGRSGDINLSASDGKSGLRSLVVVLMQDGKEQELHRQSFDRRQWFYGAGPSRTDAAVSYDTARAKFKDGAAELVIVARDFSLNGMFKGNETITRLPVQIDTTAPRIALHHAQRYIRPGGGGIVVYDLSEPVEVHGAVVNGRLFKGFPVPELENRYIAYIALPWDSGKIEESRVIATDRAGNEGQAVFSMIFKNVPGKSDSINVSDGFLNAKIPEFELHYPEMTGSQLDKYLYVNNEVRRMNAETIADICSRSEPERLWKDRFLRMSGQNMAGYAEQRTYYYAGKEIDRQVHLGIDIASTTNAEIKAANRGKVVLAEYLGIYGNTVILDHGQGVFSLYSHLSRIEAGLGEIVDQGAVIAYSGMSGMAGGDHLHFSMLIHGLFVTPIEWWDQHWIDVNIQDILGQL